MASIPAPRQQMRRRRWSSTEKQRVVELTLREGASVTAIAREHGISATSLFQWRTLHQQGQLGAQLPAAVRVPSIAVKPTFLPVRALPQEVLPTGAGGGSVVQLTLPSGVVLRMESGALDPTLICALLAQVQR